MKIDFIRKIQTVSGFGRTLLSLTLILATVLSASIFLVLPLWSCATYLPKVYTGFALTLLTGIFAFLLYKSKKLRYISFLFAGQVGAIALLSTSFRLFSSVGIGAFVTALIAALIVQAVVTTVFFIGRSRAKNNLH